MNASSALNLLRAKPFQVTIIAAFVLILIDAVLTGRDLWENFALQDNDDILRLVMVRDWIAGQGWFDTNQYRIIPPEGISIHWSRYIDAGIAAIIVPLSWVLPMPTAEVLAAAIWPTLIMLINVALIGLGTRRVFGTVAACFAVLVTVVWPVTSDLHSDPGNLDHHNIQMLMMTLMAFGVVWPSRPWLAGAIGGLAAAFSMAVGLETLPFVVGAGLVLLLRTVLERRPHINQLLVSFCLALGGGAVLLWLGQAPPATRWEPICDQLGTPTLSLIWIAVVASIVPLLVGRWISGALFHLGTTIVLTGAGLALAWSLLAPCLEGPYAQLPQELQVFISTRITEAMPFLTFAARRPEPVIQFVLPVFLTTALGAWYWVRNRRTAAETLPRNAALISLVALCAFGIGMIFLQIRTTIMAASVIPMVAGYVLGRQFQTYMTNREPVAALVGLISATAIMMPSTFSTMVRPFLPTGVGNALGGTEECRTYESLVTLNEAPPGVILNGFNFGPSLIWATHHDVLSAGYHRSAASMTNSIVPFGLEEPELQDYVRDIDATYLHLCRNVVYDSDILTELAAGSETDWLRRVPISDEKQVLLVVLPQ